MNNLKITRKSKGLTQKELAELSEIPQGHYSLIERGIYRSNEETRSKIEAAIGTKIDWIETAGIKLKNSSYYKAERCIYRLIEMIYLMNTEEKAAITNLIKKYFK